MKNLEDIWILHPAIKSVNPKGPNSLDHPKRSHGESFSKSLEDLEGLEDPDRTDEHCRTWGASMFVFRVNS